MNQQKYWNRDTDMREVKLNKRGEYTIDGKVIDLEPLTPIVFREINGRILFNLERKHQHSKEEIVHRMIVDRGPEEADAYQRSEECVDWWYSDPGFGTNVKYYAVQYFRHKK